MGYGWGEIWNKDLSTSESEVGVEAKNEAIGVTEGITHGMGWRGG